MRYVRKFKKSVITLLAVVLVVCSMTVPTSARTTYKWGNKTRTYTKVKYNVYYNGAKISSSSRYGLYINDNFMIPYKNFLVSKGPKVSSSYNSKTKVLVLKYEGKQIKMTVGSKAIYVNGKRKRNLNTQPLNVTMEGTGLIVVPAKRICEELGIKYTASTRSRKISMTKKTAVPTQNITNKNNTTTTTTSTTNTSQSNALQATVFKNTTTTQFIQALGPIAQKDYKKTGVLASVTMAQAINESGWGKSSLAQKSNNMFGMKTTLSGNTWTGSTWDGKSYVSVVTTEEYGGKKVKITARFRKYDNVASSISDHSAYLSNAKNGLKKRYAGLTDTTNYSKQLKILQTGGYCTWSGYVNELTGLIKRYNLTQFDK